MAAQPFLSTLASAFEPEPSLAAAPGVKELRRLRESEMLPDTVRTLYRQTGVALGGHLLGAIVVLWLFWPASTLVKLGAWAGLFAAVWLWRFYMMRRYETHGSRPQEARRWLKWWDVGALTSGSMWGLAAWLFYPDGNAHQQTALMVIVFTFCVGSIPLLAPQFRTFVGFVGLGVLPGIARLLTMGSPDDLRLAIVLAMNFGMIVLLGRAYRASFDGVIYLKVRTEQLAQQLQAETAVAESARREAETANRAKTQFFAAASHDLRQPLHAMGLFAEALRAKSRGDEEVSHLVNSINSSVDALEGLFGELLDITKIDTGGVEPKPQAVAMRELFQRLELQYAPTAFEKGLALRFRGGRQVVHADPVLLDRIVRNLLSNAIRYSDDGGVLVGARTRGSKVLVQVWDTGIGIAEAERARIFDEFYQVNAASALEPHQRKGLGLGLSIVKRLADLMGARLDLRSEPGHGTVFTLELPRGKLAPSPALAASANPPALGLTLERRRIVVVEDEPAVREGLVVLLKGWGATVDAFDSARSALAWAQDAASAPELAIVDYRLPEGTGVDALRALRHRFAAPLPAIVVTGSTMTGHEHEALEHDFHLLIKPVAPNKLRAMIAFKLGLR